MPLLQMCALQQLVGFIMWFSIVLAWSSQAPAEASDPIPLDKANVIVCDGLLNDQHCRFVIDTGLVFGSINEQVAIAMGLRKLDSIGVTYTTPSGRTGTAPEYADIEISIGEKKIRLMRAAAGRKDALEELLGQSVGATLGMDVLKQQILILEDFKFRFGSTVPVGFQRVSPPAASWTPEGIPCLQVTLPVLGNRAFNLATGTNMELSVTQEFADMLRRSGHAQRAPNSPGAEGPNLDMNEEIIIEKIVVANTEFRNVPALILKVNMIGMPLLGRLNIAIDGANRQIYVAESPNGPLSEFPMNASGMGVVFKSPTRLRVLGVRESSPAAAAGVLRGDEVIEVDGKSPSDLSFFQIQKLLSQDGKTIRVVLFRNHKRLEKYLLLKRTFQYPPVWKSTDATEQGFEKFLKSESSGVLLRTKK